MDIVQVFGQNFRRRGVTTRLWYDTSGVQNWQDPEIQRSSGTRALISQDDAWGWTSYMLDLNETYRVPNGTPVRVEMWVRAGTTAESQSTSYYLFFHVQNMGGFVVDGYNVVLGLSGGQYQFAVRRHTGGQPANVQEIYVSYDWTNKWFHLTGEWDGKNIRGRLRRPDGVVHTLETEDTTYQGGYAGWGILNSTTSNKTFIVDFWRLKAYIL